MRLRAVNLRSARSRTSLVKSPDQGGRQRRDHRNTATRRRRARLTFYVQAVDGAGQVVAVGEIDRAIVDRQRFRASVSAADAGH
jgi:hypothetical protein